MRPTRTRDKTMKTFSKIFASIMLLISSSAVFAQIELVHSFSSEKEEDDLYFVGKIYGEYDNYESRNFSGVEGFVQTKVDTENNTFSMNTFSSDFSSFTTKNFQFSSINGYKIDHVQITQHIFNNDDEFEFMVNYRLADNHDWESNEYEKIVVFDSKGNTIKDFGASREMWWFLDGVFILNNHAYIIIEKYNDGHTVKELYSVPTTINPNQLKSATISNTTLSAFPNPAKTYVNLSYNVSGVEDAVMTITDASGRVVEQKTVNAMSDKLHLNVANYKRGMYFYEVQGFTGRFIVE